MKHRHDRDRSLSLDMLKPLASLGLELYCVQRELRASDALAFATFGNIEHFGEALRDFSDTAALIAQLDLLIAVDTAVVHLRARWASRCG